MVDGDLGLIKSLIKDFLLILVYPLILFVGKRMTEKNDTLEKTLNDHHVRLAVTESQVKTINEDIKDIKDSIDKLPERIKNDIKDLIQNDRK